MNVLSLFDGMSCGRLALERAGFHVDNYYASEIDKFAIKVAKANYPDTHHIGDVKDVHACDLPKIDLLLGGSPCQGFSFSGKRLDFKDPRSKLFFEYVRLLWECKPRWFLMENVRMTKQCQDIISEHLGVEPRPINSNLVSAQNRYRLYWTNLSFDDPVDEGIMLKDILESGVTDRDKAHCLDANYFKGGNLRLYFEKHRRQLVFSKDGLCHVGEADINGQEHQKRVYHPDGKSPTLNTCSGGNREPKVLMWQYPRGNNKGGFRALDGKTPTLSSSEWQHNNLLTDGYKWRKLTPVECERLQTVPDNYTAHVSNSQRYKMLGNGWTVDVIAHILYQGLHEHLLPRPQPVTLRQGSL